MKIISPMGKEYEVLPCPWCGRAPDIRCYMFDPLRYETFCYNWRCPVGPCTKKYDRPGRSVDAWNRRRP